MASEGPISQNVSFSGGSLPPSESAPAAIGQPSAATSEELKQTAKNIEERMSRFEKSTLRLTRAAVAISAAAAIFVCLQWWEMHTGAIDTHTLALAAKQQADTGELNAKIERQRTIAENAAVVYPIIGYDPNGTVNLGLANRGKVLATKGTAHGTVVRILLPDLVEAGSRQNFILNFPVMRLEDGANKSLGIQKYRKHDFDAFSAGKLGFKVTISWEYDNGFGTRISDSACLIYFQMTNSPNNIPCDNARSYFLSLLPLDQKWEKIEDQNKN